MFLDSVEDKKKKILIEKIRSKWDSRDKKFFNIHKVIFTPQTLLFAYVNMIEVKSVNTKKSDKKNSENINLQKIVKDSEVLLNGSWKLKKARQVLIPKKKAGKFRLLTILSFSDKIVANSIKLVLNFIFKQCEELNVLLKAKYSHKSRRSFHSHSNKGCHNALNITMTWSLFSWFIKADIKKCYDTINQKRLISILSEFIKDQILVDTLYKFFNAPMIKVGKKNLINSKNIGLPQGNPFSLILANIYMNEFDDFIKKLKKETYENKIKVVSKKWGRFTRVSYTELVCAKTKKAKKNLKRQLCRTKAKEATKFKIEKAFKIDKPKENRAYHRLFYVRYVDDYLIAIKGPKWLARDIKNRAENFLKSNLHFQLTKKNLIHYIDNSVQFLGFDLKVIEKKNKDITETKQILSFKKLKNRLINRKNIMKFRFEKFMLKAYESQKIKFLKILMKNQKFKKNETVKLLASIDAFELKNA